MAAAPAAFIGVQAATLKLALDGVGKAFSTALTGDAKQFEAALKSLSPAAQAPAKEVRGLKPAFDALTVFRQPGGIVQNVGSILVSVFASASGAGGGFLANFQNITGQVAAFLKTASGQSAVGNVFATISTIAVQLGPILSALVTRIGQVAPALAPVFATRARRSRV